jgi:hypothetical protein
MEAAIRLAFPDEADALVGALGGARDGGAANAATTTSAMRGGLALMQDGNWVAAFSQLNSSIRDHPGSLGDVKALIALCNFRMTGIDAESDIRGALSFAPDGPVAQLTWALLYDAHAQEQQDPVAKMRLRAQSVGRALTYLVHPASASLPSNFRDMAMAALQTHCPCIGMVPTQSAPVKRLPKEEKWRQKAQQARSQALKDLLKLTGLSSIKENLMALYDMIELDKERGVDLKEQQYSALFYGNPGTGTSCLYTVDRPVQCMIGAGD